MFAALRRKHRRSRARRDAQTILSSTLESVMSEAVVATRPSATLVQAATRMVAEDVSCIVVTKDDVPVGIISERDIIKKVPASPKALELRVEDVMSEQVVCASPKDTIKDSFSLMRERGFRRLVIVRDGVLVGIITQSDLVLFIQRTLKAFASSKPLVKDWMAKKILSTKTSDSFAAAKKQMIRHDVGALLVKGKKGFEGIFTERDVVAQFYDQGGRLEIKHPRDIMHEHIRGVTPGASIVFANRLMLAKKIRRLLVVDGEKPVGVLTQTDVLDALMSACEELSSNDSLEALEFSRIKKRVEFCGSYVSEHYKVYS